MPCVKLTNLESSRLFLSDFLMSLSQRWEGLNSDLTSCLTRLYLPRPASSCCPAEICGSRKHTRILRHFFTNFTKRTSRLARSVELHWRLPEPGLRAIFVIQATPKIT